MSLRRAALVSAGLYAPGEPVPNDGFDRRYGRDISTYLQTRRNIFTRHYMATDEVTSDLAVAAGRDALAKAGLKPEDVDLLIVTTDTPDQLSPATSAVVQHKLGATRAGTFDVNAACAGFVTALAMAGHALAGDESLRRALVIGAYGMSRFLDENDFKTATVFADGAGAVVLEARDGGPGLLASRFHTDGKYNGFMGLYGGGTAHPGTRPVLEFRDRVPPETNERLWPEMARGLLDRIGRPLTDVALLFCTQINVESVRNTVAALGLPPARAYNVMDRFGYTGSACIPMALADAAANRALGKDDLVLLLSSGGGMAAAGLALTWAFDT